jgi:hypothetical protein
MSFTTGTQTEALSANVANGAAFNTFTTVQYIGTTTGAAFAPANFWLPSYGTGKTVLVKAFGVVSTTGTPTFQIGISANTTQGTIVSANQLATTPPLAGTPITMPSGITNANWELECLITCVTLGSAGTFLSDGMFKVYGSSTTLTSSRVSSSTANPNTTATLDTRLAYYLELFAGWGTSSASNTITVYNVAVLGLN